MGSLILCFIAASIIFTRYIDLYLMLTGTLMDFKDLSEKYGQKEKVFGKNIWPKKRNNWIHFSLIAFQKLLSVCILNRLWNNSSFYELNMRKCDFWEKRLWKMLRKGFSPIVQDYGLFLFCIFLNVLLFLWVHNDVEYQI